MPKRTKSQIDNGKALKAQIWSAGISYGDIVHTLNYAVTKSDVGNFIFNRTKHLSKANRALLRRYFIRKGFIKPRKRTGVRITADQRARMQRALITGNSVMWNRVFIEIRKSQSKVQL